MFSDPFDYTVLAAEYQNDTLENKELRKLINHIINNKVLRFSFNEIQNYYPLSISSGMVFQDGVITNGKDSTIKLTPLSFFGFYHEFLTALNFKVGDDIPSIQNFIKNIGDHFIENRFGITRLIEGLTELSLLISYRLYNTNIFFYAMNLHVSEPGFKLFFKAFIELLPHFKHNDTEIWQLSKHYANELGPLPEGVMDLRTPELANFLYGYTKTRSDKGNALKEIILDNLFTSNLQEIIFAICRGLHEIGTLSSSELISWIEDQDKRNLSLALFTLYLPGDKNLRDNLLSKIEILIRDSSEARVRTSRILLSLLKSEENVLTKERIKAALELLVMDTDPTVVINTIYSLGTNGDDTDFSVSLIIKLITLKRYKDEYTQHINTFFCRQPNLPNFLSFLKSYAVHVKGKFSAQSFEAAISILKEQNQIDFDKQFLLLTIDDIGSIRWAGHQILFSLSPLDSAPSNSFDILNMDAVSQYKLAVSLITPYHPVKQTIPIIAPLLSSSFAIVREITLCKLETLIENYQYEVIQELDDSLSNDVLDRASILLRLNDFLKQLEREIQIKLKLRELDPNYSQASLMRIYFDAYKKKWKSSMRQNAKESRNISNMFQQVQIARGGGWKLPNKSEIQSLGLISVSMALPRTMFIKPELMDYERHLFYFENWENEYKEWEQRISS